MFRNGVFHNSHKALKPAITIMVRFGMYRFKKGIESVGTEIGAKGNYNSPLFVTAHSHNIDNNLQESHTNGACEETKKKSRLCEFSARSVGFWIRFCFCPILYWQISFWPSLFNKVRLKFPHILLDLD